MAEQAGRGQKRVKGKKVIEKKNVALKTLKIEYVSIENLRENPYNPNRQSDHEFELLCRSMREDGFTQPIVAAVVDEAHCADPKFKGKYTPGDLVIVDGYHRWKAGRHLGLKEVPYVDVPMTVEQMRIATLRHNRARGSEDIELSAEVLRDLQQLGALDWAKDSLMLDDAELNKLLDDIPAPEALAGAEFGTAWDPVSNADAVTLDQDMVETKDRGVAASGDAVDRLRAMEKKIAEAKSDQEKEAARKEANIYRLVLVFTGDQATIVKQALGDTPAESVL
ncbi:hypothetical protein LCGC14_1827000, partial [marine sediment metagenome]